LGDYKPPVSSNVEVELPIADPLDESDPNADDTGESEGTDGPETAEGEEGQESAEDDPGAALLREMKQQK
jgi:hypothetical protein